MKTVDGESWLEGREVLHRSTKNGGLLVRLDEGRVAKVFPSKGWILGWARILRGSTKAHKQARSMRRLRELGITTPEPEEVVCFTPRSGGFEGALVYEYVGEAADLRKMLPGGSSADLMQKLAEDLVTMAKGGVLFVDLNPGNVLVMPDGNLCWIDAEVVEGIDQVRKNLWNRVLRMRRKGLMPDLTDDEWMDFCRSLDGALADPESFEGRPAGMGQDS